jgi:hypothetical protein
MMMKIRTTEAVFLGLVAVLLTSRPQAPFVRRPCRPSNGRSKIAADNRTNVSEEVSPCLRGWSLSAFIVKK